MADVFAGVATPLEGPASNLALITPDNDADLATATRAIYVAVAGTVRLTTVGGQTITTPELAQGWHPIRAVKVFATSTTATGLMGAW